MGSMLVDLPIPYTMLMFNSWEIIGNFMYPARAFAEMLGLLDISAIRPKVFAFEQLNEAMDAATEAGNFDNVLLSCKPKK
jgi:alcohol dehydrogenase